MKLTRYVFFIIFIGYSTTLAGDKVVLPANNRIFFNEQDCYEVMELHYSWNIEFAAQLREMEKNGKFIKNPQASPITVLETKSYRMHNYYKISIYNDSTKQDDIVWTDAAKLD